MKKMFIVSACIITLGFVSSVKASTEHYWRFEQPAPYDDEGYSAASSLSSNLESIVSDTAVNAPGDTSVYLPSGGSMYSNFNDPTHSAFTFELFFKTSSTSPSILVSDFFIAGPYRATSAATLEINSTGNLFLEREMGRDTLILWESDNVLADGQWHHFALTQTSAEYVAVYVDSNLEYANAGGFFNDRILSPVTLQNQITLGGGYEGNLDEIRVSSEVLAPEQFLNTYSAPTIPEPVSVVLLGLSLVSMVYKRIRNC